MATQAAGGSGETESAEERRRRRRERRERRRERRQRRFEQEQQQQRQQPAPAIQSHDKDISAGDDRECLARQTENLDSGGTLGHREVYERHQHRHQQRQAPAIGQGTNSGTASTEARARLGLDDRIRSWDGGTESGGGRSLQRSSSVLDMYAARHGGSGIKKPTQARPRDARSARPARPTVDPRIDIQSLQRPMSRRCRRSSPIKTQMQAFHLDGPPMQ